MNDPIAAEDVCFNDFGVVDHYGAIFNADGEGLPVHRLGRIHFGHLRSQDLSRNHMVGQDGHKLGFVFWLQGTLSSVLGASFVNALQQLEQRP